MLSAAGVGLDQVAARAGTPTYVYSAPAVRAAYVRIAAAFAPLGGRVAYAVKANAGLALLRLLAGLGAGFDVVGGGELLAVQRAGGRPDEIVFAGTGKSAAELTLAVDTGVTVHVESADELDALEQTASGRRRSTSIGIRVRPGVDSQTAPEIATGHHASKFGVPPALATELLERAASGGYPHLRPVGVHVHVGSQLPDPSPMVAGAEVALGVLDAGRRLGLELDRLDVGGGIPVDYGGGEVEPEPFATALAPLLAGRRLRLTVEPGRSLVARAGALLAQVRYRKHDAADRRLVLDTGMHHFLRPALYGAVHRVLPVYAAEPVWPTELVGPICESTDVVADAAALPDLAPGDLVAILDAGAYGMSMASNYNGQGRPAEVLVDGGAVVLTRRRESWDDLLACELDPPEPL